MKILTPDEVEKQNIITKRELQAVLVALQPYGRMNASRAQIKMMDSVALKIQKVLKEMKS